jgi:hypothetical protein
MAEELLSVSAASLPMMLLQVNRVLEPQATVGPYSSPMPRNIWCSMGGYRFLMSEVSL